MAFSQGKRESFISFVVQHKLFVLLTFLLVGTVFAFGATRIKTEVILAHLFPYDHPYLKLHAQFSEVFGSGGSGVVIAVNVKEGDIFNQKALGKIKGITEEVELWDEVYRILTVSIASQSTKVVKTKAKGEIIIDQLMFPDIPKDDQEMALLKKHIFSNPAYNGILVSSDGTAALVLTEMKENISYERMFVLLQDLVERFSDENTSIHIVGFPMLMGWIYSYKPQIILVFGISVALMVLILFLIFRNLVGLVAPVAMSVICTCLGLGFIGWTGINFSPLLYVLAFLVGARMLSNAVQITHRYIEEFGASGDKKVAMHKTMQAMLMPNAAAVATDAAGFLVLGLARIVLMQQLAIMMSFWMTTILLEGVLVPVICSYLPLKRDTGSPVSQKRQGWLGKASVSLTHFSITSGRFTVGMVVGVTLVFCTWQTTRLKVGDPTPGSPILWSDHTYNRDQALINQKFDASSENFVLYYEGSRTSVYDPIVLKTFETFSQYMSERLPDIYKSSSSIIDMGKMVNLTFHDGDQIWYQLPRNEEQLSGLLGYIRNTVGSGVLGRFIDPSLERSQITLFFSDHTSDTMLRIREAAYDFFSNNPMKTEKGEFKLAGGRIGMEIGLNEEMKRSHVVMDTLVLVAIFIMCSLAFRSLVAGAMLTVPLILSNLIAFSYMAVTDIGLSANTLPCSAVGVGVGVDFAIYLYSRCIEEYPHHNDWVDTVMTSVSTAGKGIVFTGITLILPIITWYFISELKFQAQMGFFLSMLLFTNMIAAFTLHPLLIVMIRPRFMQKGAAFEHAEAVKSN